MAFRGVKYAVGLAVQSAADTPATITAPGDLLLCYDVQPGGNGFTLANPETTGTVDRPGDAVLGSDRSITMNIILRGPGGSAPPGVGVSVMGRILRAARFAETVQAAPLLASTALGAVSTATAITLPAGASAVDDFYNGLPVMLSDQGVGANQLSMVRDYAGGTKVATMMETFSPVPAANVTVPAFLGYRYNSTAPELWLSVDWWMDKKRYKMVNGVVSSLTFNFNVSNNADTSFTYMSVTITGDVHPTTPELDEDSPEVGQGGAMPVFRDADWWLANKSICGSSMTAELAFQTDRAPCPTRQSGGEAPQIVSATRSANLTINEVLLSVQDYRSLAAAQLEHGTWVRYGNTSGKTVMFGITDARLGFSEANVAGNFVQRTQPLLIDKTEKAMSLIFPYWP